jgi:hypothetical protein
MEQTYPIIYFKSEEGETLGNDDRIMPFPLYKGMTITIHGREGRFQVVDWNYHHGQPDEEAGLRIILRRQ